MIARRTLLAAPLLARRAAASDWPDKPVRIIIPFGAGGPIDAMGRVLAEPLRDRLGQPFVIDNRPGAGGSIGLRAVVQAPPDGSAFVLTSSSLASIPALYPNGGLDTRQVTTPISVVAEVPTMVTVAANSPMNDIPALLREARARPGQLTYGSGGVGSSNHLSGALFAHVAGVELTHVSYRGAAPAMTAVLAGEIDLLFASTVETLPHVRGGRAKFLATTQGQRLPALPDVPSASEAVPGYEAVNWYGIVGPPGLPDAIVARFSAALMALREDAEVAARFTRMGAGMVLSTPALLRDRLQTEVPQWQRLVAAAGIRVE